jgi:hypothetical protein
VREQAELPQVANLIAELSVPPDEFARVVVEAERELMSAAYEFVMLEARHSAVMAYVIERPPRPSPAIGAATHKGPAQPSCTGIRRRSCRSVTAPNHGPSRRLWCELQRDNPAQGRRIPFDDDPGEAHDLDPRAGD